MITLQLRPGIHYAHANLEPAEDIPLDPLDVTVPLYPGAVLTDREQEHANFHYQLSGYLKSAVASYEVPAGEEEVERWYLQAFEAAGFEKRGEGTSAVAGVKVSRGVHFELPSAPRIRVDISLVGPGSDRTHLLYVATAITPPPRPRESYLRGEFERVRITYVPWAVSTEMGRPRLYREITDPDEIAELVNAVNSNGEVIGNEARTGRMDRGQGAWMLFEPVRGAPTFVELRPAHRLVYVGHARALMDQWSRIWQVVERLMAGQG